MAPKKSKQEVAAETKSVASTRTKASKKALIADNVSSVQPAAQKTMAKTAAKKAADKPAPKKAAATKSAATKPATKPVAAKTETAKSAAAAKKETTKATAPKASAKTTTKKTTSAPDKSATKSTSKKRTSDEAQDDDAAQDTAAAQRTKRVRTEEPVKPKAEPKASKIAQPKPPKPKNIINKAPTTRQNVYVFGDGSAGELGFGASKGATDVKRPRLNANLAAETVGVVAIAVGGMHVVALTHDNRILTWGVNDNGALGRDTTWGGGLIDMDEANKESDDSDDDDAGLELNPRESTPTEVLSTHFPAGTTFVQLAAGDSCSFALTDEGLVYGWGTFRDDKGVFGFTLNDTKETVLQSNTPILIPGLKNIKQIQCGENHALALDDKGAVYAWGSGQQDQLGRRIVQRHAAGNLVPTSIALPKRGKISAVVAGPNHSFAIEKSGAVWSWGLNSFAQCGIPYGPEADDDIVTAPTKVKALVNIQTMGAGGQHSLALTQDGTILSFGRTENLALGVDQATLPLDDPTVVRMDDKGKLKVLFRPTEVPVPKAKYIACGTDHNVIITTDGKAYSWGFNTSYQCGQGEEDDIAVPTLINNQAVREKKMSWAGCGGQFSMLSSDAEMSNA